MRSKKSELTKQKTFEYLLLAYGISVDHAWKYYERGWEVFKFYITLTTGVVGLLVTLFTAGFDISNLISMIPVLALILFAVGISVFIQLINIDIDQDQELKHHILLRDQIAEHTDLDDYFEARLKKLQYTKAYSTQETKYKVSGLIKRAILASGVKTQLVIINSAIGTLGLYFFAFSSSPIISQQSLLIGTLFFVALIILHGLYGSLRGRSLNAEK